MTDIKTLPLNDGDSSTPAREKTVAELENEARERTQAQRQASAPVDDVKPDQPEVNQLKKRGNNRLMTPGILLLAVLIVLAWMGDWIYAHFMNAPAQTSGQTEAVQDEVSSGSRRHDMGLAANPMGVQTVTASTPATGETLPAAAPRATFSKAMALDAVSDTPDNGQATPASRAEEREGQAVTTPPASSPYVPCTVKLVQDAKGDLVCPAGAEASPESPPAVSAITGVQRIRLDPDLYIPVDTYIPCTLQTRFVSDVAGHISCLISGDVYSESKHVRLIPAGTRARGVYKTGTLNHGQGRMFVMWTGLRTPNGLKIPMVDAQVVGQLGESGIDGWVDTHFWERFGNAMLLSTVQDVAAAAAGASPSKDRNTDYTENSRAAAAEMAKAALDNSINIPPTMYKNQGDIIGIMTGSDIDFSHVYKLEYRK